MTPLDDYSDNTCFSIYNFKSGVDSCEKKVVVIYSVVSALLWMVK